MGAVGGIIAVVFGIIWTLLAFAITRNAPFPLVGTVFPLFGVLFIIIGIANVAYNLRNTTAKNRFSNFDITTDQEEPDPLNQRFGPAKPPVKDPPKNVGERLAELDQLKVSRAISEEEYQSQRKRILEQI